jgi:hypothetical protein
MNGRAKPISSRSGATVWKRIRQSDRQLSVEELRFSHGKLSGQKTCRDRFLIAYYWGVVGGFVPLRFVAKVNVFCSV